MAPTRPKGGKGRQGGVRKGSGGNESGGRNNSGGGRPCDKKNGGSNAGEKRPRLMDQPSESESESDEEIDEDMAFNSDDERKYGAFFLGKNSAAKKAQTGRGLKDGGDHVSGDSDSDDGSSSGEDESESEDEHDWAGSGDDSEDEDDDGGQYMLDLLNNLDSVPAAGKSDKNEKDTPKKDGDKKPPASGEEAKKDGGRIQIADAAAAAAFLPESEFRAGSLTSSSKVGDDNVGGGAKLTLDSLMGGISDTSGFASVQRTMHALSGGPDASTKKSNKKNAEEATRAKRLETTKVPVARVVSERASRKVHYDATSKDVTKWQNAVHEQRDAETLDFRANKNIRLTGDELVAKFEPRSKFEEEMAAALEEAGMEDEKEMEKKERKGLIKEGEDGDDDGWGDDEEKKDGDLDDLGLKRISVEDYKKRHGELSKMRALLFYEEQKNHRIKKIKSKKYRKIRKRQRERVTDAETEAALEEGDTELERELREKEEMNRMEERMTLAHKNTSKWARRVLRRGSNVEMDERRALSVQLAKGEELRRKAMGEDGEGAGSDDDMETEQDLLERARDVLKETEGDDDGGDEATKKKGLFQLQFMKRGMETQRVRAREEARRLLRELEDHEIEMNASSGDDNDDADKKEKTKKRKVQDKVASEAEVDMVLPKGSMVASALQFSSGGGGLEVDGGRFSVAVDGEINLGGNEEEKEEETTAAGNDDGGSKKKKRKKNKKNKGKGEKEITDANGEASPSPPPQSNKDNEEEANPWVTATAMTDDMEKGETEDDKEGETATAANGGGSNKKKGKKNKKKTEVKDSEAEANPWVTAADATETKNSGGAAATPRKAKKSSKLPHSVDIDGAAGMLVDDDGDGGGGARRKSKSTSSENGSEGSGANADATKTEGADDDKSEKSDGATKAATQGVASLSQAELVRRAFAAPADLAEEEFQKEKDEMRERDDPARKQKEEKKVTGWGSWAGEGAPPPRKRRAPLPKRLRAPDSKLKEKPSNKRKDDGLSTVIINEKRMKKAAQFQMGEIPYPYTSREQYERAMAGGIGREWNTTGGVKEMTRKDVIVRAGKIIKPIAKKSKAKRTPAKF